MTVNAVRLNHAVLFVADLERSIAFYQQAFDMTVMAREPRANAAFLRLPRSGQPPRPRPVRGRRPAAPPARLASGSTTWPGRSTPSRSSRRPGSPWPNLDAFTGESSHGATKSVYAHDPDGNEFEVMWMLPKASWGEYENAAPVERLDLPGEVAPLGRRPHRRRARPGGRVMTHRRSRRRSSRRTARTDPAAPLVVPASTESLVGVLGNHGYEPRLVDDDVCLKNCRSTVSPPNIPT